MDDIIATRVDNLLQLRIGLQVPRFQGVALKRSIIVRITVGNDTVGRVLVIISRGDCRFPAHFLEHLEIWNVELHNVRLYNGRNK